jgi:FG-GAP repeat/FG-GAP-like repeat
MQRLRTTLWGSAATVGLLAGVAFSAQPVAAAIQPPVINRAGWHDFNGDGRDDLAIGVPNEDVGSAAQAGAVVVLYGAKAGLTGQGSQLLTEGSAGIPGPAKASDHFGASLAYGDFDGDGYGDLAIGVPDRDVKVGSKTDADVGIVIVLHGSPTGLHATEPNIVVGSDRGDRAGAQFGAALAADDFLNPHKAGGVGNDGLADLAVGSPGASKVHVFSGQRFSATQHKTYIADYSGPSGSRFGAALATGAFGTKTIDVAVGAPAADSAAGTVTIEKPGGTQVLFQGDGIVIGAQEKGDRFGSALAAADLNGDGWDELIVGVPREDVNTTTDAGVFHVLWTKPKGTFSSGPFYTQEAGGGAVEKGDQFGSSIAVGGIGPNGSMAIAVGAPLEDFGPIDVGTVGVFHRTSGTTLSGSFYFQGTGKVGGTGEQGDHFGAALSVGHFDAGATGDLAIGVPHEKISGKVGAGQVQVLYGGSSGTDGTKEQLWNQDSPNVPDSAEANDAFGSAVR